MPDEVIHRVCQGVLYFQENKLIHRTHTNTIPFALRRKVWHSPRWFSRKSQMLKSGIFARLKTNFHQNLTINMESVDRNSFTPLSKACLSVGRLCWNSQTPNAERVNELRILKSLYDIAFFTYTGNMYVMLYNVFIVCHTDFVYWTRCTLNAAAKCCIP